MRIAVAGRSCAVLVFPPDDYVLGMHVRELLEHDHADDAATTATALRDQLSTIYPRVAIRLREEFAGFGERVAYVFRDGSALPEQHDLAWVDDPHVARVVTDAAGTYVEANAAASELFGVQAADIVGRGAGTFTRADARIADGHALWAELERTGRVHSLAVLRVPGREDRHVEFVTLRDADGRGRNTTMLRAIE